MDEHLDREGRLEHTCFDSWHVYSRFLMHCDEGSYNHSKCVCAVGVNVFCAREMQVHDLWSINTLPRGEK
jgi:hypothetical protein